MAGLCKRGNRWVITTRDANGRPTKIATGETDRKRAEIKRALYEREQELQIADPYREHRLRPFAEHIEDFYEHQVATGMTRKQADEVRMRIERVFAAANITKFEHISESVIQTTIAKMRQRPHCPDKTEDDMPLLSPRTRNHYRRSVYTFTRWLYRDKRVPDEPLRRLRTENADIEPRHNRTLITDEQFGRLYSTALSSERIIQGYTGEQRAMAYLLSVATGLRRSELASLSRQSFRLDYTDPYVVVEAAFSKHRRKDTIRLPKGILPQLRAFLRGLDPRRRCSPAWETSAPAK